MNQERSMTMPAEYAVLSEEEMTYTEGGSKRWNVFQTAATVVGTVVLGASYIWGIGTARSWLRTKGNSEGNVFTILGRAVDDIGEDMTQSPANCLRDVVSTAMVVGLAPVSLVLVLV